MDVLAQISLKNYWIIIANDLSLPFDHRNLSKIRNSYFFSFSQIIFRAIFFLLGINMRAFLVGNFVRGLVKSPYDEKRQNNFTFLAAILNLPS